MVNKKLILIWFFSFIIIISTVGIFNYLVNPYGLKYVINIFNFERFHKTNKIRLVKAMDLHAIKPKSIILGTSRAEYGYDPNHAFFLKPSYNASLSSGTMYEAKLYFEWALKQGNLKQVLLVADYIMFNYPTSKPVKEVEDYADGNYKYKILFSNDTLIDSIQTTKGINRLYTKYLNNGQIDYKNIANLRNKNPITKKSLISQEKRYYKNIPTDYKYVDNGKSSFDDFSKIIELSYKNNIQLTIITGPSHVRQWESLNYFINFDKWLKWKKDMVLKVEEISSTYSNNPYEVVDFAVYHNLTSEKITDGNINMKYYWESSHYKNELGLIVLNRLLGKNKFQDFGVTLNKKNVEEHLNQQKIKRKEFLDRY